MQIPISLLILTVACNDSILTKTTTISEGDSPGECSDDIDNDEDGFTDCEDQDCKEEEDCQDDILGMDTGTDTDTDTDTGTDTGMDTDTDTDIPTIDLVTLSPDPIRTNDTLTATAQLSTETDSSAAISWNWSINGALTGNTISELDGSQFDKGDLITAEAIASHNGIQSVPASASITVSNTAPNSPGISMSTPAPIGGLDDLICTIITPATDDDGDNVSYTASWDVNGFPYPTPSTTTFNGDTILAIDSSAGDVWTCTVTPNDGTDDGQAASTSIFVGSGSLCTTSLDSLSSPTSEGSASGGGGQGIGTWIGESSPSGTSNFWVMMDYDNDQITEYSSLSDLNAGSGTSYNLADNWAGTGHVVLNGVLYYNETASDTIVAYDTISGTEVTRNTLVGAGYDNTYAYSYGATTDIDFAADDGKLYVIYSTSAAAGKFVVSQLDPISLTVMTTWTATSELKGDYTGAFIACGILYGIDSQAGGPCFWCTNTSIDFAWDLNGGSSSDPAIPFTSPGSSGYIGGVQYNPADGLIYVMRGGSMGRISPTWN